MTTINFKNVPSQAEMDKIMEQKEKERPTEKEALSKIKDMRKRGYRMISLMYAVNIFAITCIVIMIMRGHPTPYLLLGVIGFMAIHFMMTMIRLFKMSDQIGDRAIMSASKALRETSDMLKKTTKKNENK